VQIAAGDGGPLPSAEAVLSYQNQGATLTMTSVPMAKEGSIFEMYLQSAGLQGQPGSVEPGIVVSNASTDMAAVRLEVVGVDGRSAGISTLREIPPGGQLAGFIREFFPQVPDSFIGFVRVSATVPVAVAGIRRRFNERGEFVLSAVPAWNEKDVGSSAVRDFPITINGSRAASLIFLPSLRELPVSETGSVLMDSTAGGVFEMAQ
jgi:hypothetical protein